MPEEALQRCWIFVSFSPGVVICRRLLQFSQNVLRGIKN